MLHVPWNMSAVQIIGYIGNVNRCIGPNLKTDPGFRRDDDKKRLRLQPFLLTMCQYYIPTLKLSP